MSNVPPTKEQIAAGASVVIDAITKIADVSAVPEALRPIARQLGEKLVADLIEASGINVQDLVAKAQLGLQIRAQLQSYLGH